METKKQRRQKKKGQRKTKKTKWEFCFQNLNFVSLNKNHEY